jgi:AcrR family transcriptional regulator
MSTTKTKAKSLKKSLKWERRPEERPRELLEAALAVFARKGYRNTRLDDVAEAAGVTKGAIYHYFDTKEDLLLSVIEHYQSLAFGRAEEVLQNRQLPASTRIQLLVQKIFSGGERKNRNLLGLLIRGIAHEVPRVHERWLKNGPVRLWRLVAGLIDEGIRAGEFRADADSDVAARLLISGIILQRMWLEHAEAVPALAIDDGRLLDSAVELFLASLRRHVITKVGLKGRVRPDSGSE